MAVVNDRMAQYWSALAPAWLDSEERLDEVSGEPGRLALERLDLRSGHAVIDLGCGTGRTTVGLAEAVGPEGSVLGVDIAPEMLACGRQLVAELGFDNVELRTADVQADDLGVDRFDRAYSRFGVMFFEDPVAAFANVRRALRPGGRLSFVCWQNVFANEWMLVPGMAAMSVLGGPPSLPGPDEPGPFSLADPDKVRSVLAAAGFEEVDVVDRNDSVLFSEDRIPQVATASIRVGAVAEAVRATGDETRMQVQGAVEKALRERVVGGEVSQTRGILLTTARA